MRALSLWQPWASLWCSRRKVHETRHWRCSHRGWLLVHAAKRFERNFALENPLRAILEDEFGSHWALDLATGALIGIVKVVDCLTTEMLFGDAAVNNDDRDCTEIFRLDVSPGNAMSFDFSTSQFRIGAHKVSSTCPTT